MLIPLGFLASSGGAAGSYELIQSSILTSTATSVTFSSIPQDYKHLQLRVVSKTGGTSNNFENWLATYNNVSTSNQSAHFLFGDGSNVYSSAITNWDQQFVGVTATSSSTTFNANEFATSIIDVLDYSSTTKNKTTRSFTGVTGGTSGKRVALYSSLLQSTTAITSIRLDASSVNWAIGSRFSLYGIKG